LHQQTMSLPAINPASLTKYAKAVIKCDLSALSKTQQQALLKLRQAATLMDEIFMVQCTGQSLQQWRQSIKSAYQQNDNANNPNFLDGVSESDYLLFVTINMGPWDRLSDDVHEQKENPKPKGVAFYPTDLTVDEFTKWTDSVNAADSVNSVNAKGFFTSIVRDPKTRALSAVPFNAAYKEWLSPAAILLNDAADLLTNESMQTFLRARAKAFASNEYAQSDVAWLHIDKESQLDVTIGPYEVYEDELMNQKAAFEAFVCLTDAAGSANIQLFADKLQELEDNLPCADKFKNQNVVQGKPIVVVDEIAIGGDRGGPQTAAFNLPNDESVTSEHGNKLVILRNIQRAKFEKVLEPIANNVMADTQRELVTFDAFFNHILCHEMCHSLGPHVLEGAEATPRRRRLRRARCARRWVFCTAGSRRPRRISRGCTLCSFSSNRGCLRVRRARRCWPRFWLRVSDRFGSD